MGYRKPDFKTWKSSKISQGYYSQFNPFTTVDGPGVRCALYVSGCLFACDGCFNKKAWSFKNGQPYTLETKNQIIETLSIPYIQGISLLGGEPFLNTPHLIELTKHIKENLPDKDIWVWSGFTIEQILMFNDDKLELLKHCDVLVDGPYIKEKRALNTYTGSSNQRVIDIEKSLKTNNTELLF